MIGLYQSLYEFMVISVYAQQFDSGPKLSGRNPVGVNDFSSSCDIFALVIEVHQQNIFRINHAVCFKLEPILTDIQRHSHVSIDDVAVNIQAIVRKTFFYFNPLTCATRCILHIGNASL
jgi:hypothetical protein